MAIHLSTVRTFLGYTIPQKALMLFFDSVAIQLNVGRPIPDSLLAASHNSGDKELQQICAEAAPKLTRGASLCHCLRPYESRFPEMVMPILEVGEVSGSLSESAQRLADTFKQTYGAEREMKTSAYSHPKALLGLCLVDLISLLMTVDSRQPLMDTAIRIGLDVVLFGCQLVMIFFVSRVVLRELYRWRPLRLIVDTIKLALPGLGIVTRNLAAARWARSFAVLWRAGINISTALEVSSRSALNAHYEKELRHAAAQTRQGKSITDSLIKTQLLPPNLLAVIRTCEITGRLDDNLIHMAREMEADALNRSIKEMNRIIMSVYVFLMILAVLHILSQSGL